jgi:phosphohistidine swiveling domain-containing protein
MTLEVEDLLCSETLDLEFALLNSGELYLLQARNLVLDLKDRLTLDQHRDVVATIADRVDALNKPHPYLLGRRTLFGIMPDWNPAEIVGVRPRPLALSLYKDLVTDAIWAYQRDNYGYRNLRSFPLIISFFGLPYVDVRVSFNSFIPRNISHDLAARLADYYLERLADQPHLHDKVEFDILFSCYTPDLPERIEKLGEYGFSADERAELANGLRELTNTIINGKNGLWQQDRNRVGELEKRQDQIMDCDLDAISRIYWLLEDCKRYGTLPFAGLARAGFIAVQLLNSLLNVGVLDKKNYDAFLSSLNTVSSQLNRDYRLLPREIFLARYGHLRPGTYDVLSPRYDEKPDLYFSWPPSDPVAGKDETPVFTLSLPQLKMIETLLKEHKLEHDVLGLFEFIKSGIEGREYAKFVFTKSLSNALSLFKELCISNGLSEDDCSYVDIRTVHDIYSSSVDTEKILKRSCESGRADYDVTQQIWLPPLMSESNDIWSFTLPDLEPNFITQKRAVGPVVLPSSGQDKFEGSVVMFDRADPGYDWIFSKGIVGLITKYGGVNSHMAIRAGELGVPAVIGAGDTHFDRWSAAQIIDMDCGNREVRVLK